MQFTEIDWVNAFVRRMSELGPYRRAGCEWIARSLYPLCGHQSPAEAADQHYRDWHGRR